MLGLTGAAKWIAIAAIAVPLLSGCAYFVHLYNNAIINGIALEEEKKTAALQMEETQRTITGLLTEAANAENRAKANATLKGAINANPSSRACVSSPAYRSLVSGVRAAAGGGQGDGPSKAAGPGVAVPARATAAR